MDHCRSTRVGNGPRTPTSSQDSAHGRALSSTSCSNRTSEITCQTHLGDRQFAPAHHCVPAHHGRAHRPRSAGHDARIRRPHPQTYLARALQPSLHTGRTTRPAANFNGSNAVNASPKPYWRNEDIADFRGASDEDDPKIRAMKAVTWAMLRRENIDGLLGKDHVPGVSRDGKTRNLPAFRLRHCPHCDKTGQPHPLDIVREPRSAWWAPMLTRPPKWTSRQHRLPCRVPRTARD